MPESLFRDTPIHIETLATELPAREPVIDVTDLLQRCDLRFMKADIDSEIQSHDIVGSVGTCIAELRLLSPDFYESEIKDKKYWDRLIGAVNEFIAYSHYRGGTRGWDFVERVAALRMLYPEQFSALDSYDGIKSMVRRTVESEIKRVNPDINIPRVLDWANIAFPGEYKNHPLNALGWEILYPKLKETAENEHFMSERFSADRGIYLFYLAKLRLAYPDRLDLLQPEPGMFRMLPTDFEREFKGAHTITRHFVQTMFRWKVAAAQHVIVNEDGVTLVMPHDELDAGDDIPQIRKY